MGNHASQHELGILWRVRLCHKDWKGSSASRVAVRDLARGVDAVGSVAASVESRRAAAFGI